MLIKPSTILRNDYNQISKLAHDTDEPVYITKNGEGDLVVMSIKTYEKREHLMCLYENLVRAEERRLNGAPTISLEEAEEKLLKELEDSYESNF